MELHGTGSLQSFDVCDAVRRSDDVPRRDECACGVWPQPHDTPKI